MFLGFHSETKSKRRKGREIANLVQYKTILLQCVFRNCWLRFLFERDSLDMFFITLLRHRHFRRIDVHQCSCNLYIPRNKESNLHDENCTQENVKYHINRDVFWENEGNYMKQDVWKSFFIINLQVGISQLHYGWTSSQIVFRDFKQNECLWMALSGA